LAARSCYVLLLSSAEEEAAGCETGGPVRPWLAIRDARGDYAPTDAELVAVLVQTAAPDE
jgi:hypothetical protein